MLVQVDQIVDFGFHIVSIFYTFWGTRQIGAPGKLAPGKLSPSKLGPGKLSPANRAPGKLGPDVFVQCTNTEMLIHRLTNIQIMHIIIASIDPIQIYALGNIYVSWIYGYMYLCQLNSYIGIGYILPTIGGYMSIGRCLCRIYPIPIYEFNY